MYNKNEGSKSFVVAIVRFWHCIPLYWPLPDYGDLSLKHEGGPRVIDNL